MGWKLSEFGEQLCSGSGIGDLMADLGHALAIGGDRIRMLGGGQPAHIPEVDALWRSRMLEICERPGALEQVLGDYDEPVGSMAFRVALSSLFQREFGWPIGPENVAITAGGQTAFFFLFNALAGNHDDGKRRRILFPLVPEYIGYANQSVSGDMFRSVRPEIEKIGDHRFKYHVDFDRLRVDDDVAGICVSRPTNPTGNVLTDDEMTHLAALAEEHAIPLIVDNAYGAPIPNAIFTSATPTWNENTILTLSLSKLGLPGTRTGIVVARESMIQSIASMTSIVGLANSNMGQALVTPLLESGEILRVCNEIVQPFYRERSRFALECVDSSFDDTLPYRVHQTEGAFFLWFWFDQLPITCRELYERLKARDVLIVPGGEFFFGAQDQSWRHRHECIRVSYSMPREIVQDGIRVIAEEVSKAYGG